MNPVINVGPIPGNMAQLVGENLRWRPNGVRVLRLGWVGVVHIVDDKKARGPKPGDQRNGPISPRPAINESHIITLARKRFRGIDVLVVLLITVEQILNEAQIHIAHSSRPESAPHPCEVGVVKLDTQ